MVIRVHLYIFITQSFAPNGQARLAHLFYKVALFLSCENPKTGRHTLNPLLPFHKDCSLLIHIGQIALEEGVEPKAVSN